jgi:hypothetical protein
VPALTTVPSLTTVPALTKGKAQVSAAPRRAGAYMPGPKSRLSSVGVNTVSACSSGLLRSTLKDEVGVAGQAGAAPLRCSSSGTGVSGRDTCSASYTSPCLSKLAESRNRAGRKAAETTRARGGTASDAVAQIQPNECGTKTVSNTVSNAVSNAVSNTVSNAVSNTVSNAI